MLLSERIFVHQSVNLINGLFKILVHIIIDGSTTHCWALAAFSIS
jgi:hypothetical protein